jgi:hypothetical protein
MHVLQKRSIEPDAASRSFAIIIFLFLSLLRDGALPAGVVR